MDGLVGAAVVVAGALVAWRWWLADKSATRAHELEVRKQVVAVEQKALDAIPGRLSALEADVQALRWKKPG